METDVLHTVYELGVAAFAHNSQCALLDLDFNLARAKRTAEDKPPGIVRNVHESAHAREPPGKRAQIDAAFMVDFNCPKQGYVESAAIVEIKLRRLIDNGFRKMTATKA